MRGKGTKNSIVKLKYNNLIPSPKNTSISLLSTPKLKTSSY